LAIEIAGHNLANVNTPNYARQRVATATDVVLQLGYGQQGTGARIQEIQSMRDRLLDSQIIQQQPLSGYYDTQAHLGGLAQDALGDSLRSDATTGSQGVSSGTGLQADIDRFFGAWHNLSTSPNSAAVRNNVVESARNLAQSLNSSYKRIQQLQADIGTQADSIADSINQLSAEIASLNQQIQKAEVGRTQKANDLRDTRQQKIEELSRLVNVNVVEQSNGMVDVTLTDSPGVTLVTGIYGGGTGTTESLSVAFNAGANPPLTVSGSVSGNLGGTIPSSGKLGAHLRVANTIIGSPASIGNTGLLGDLDTLASNLVSLVNTQHAAGFDLSGTAGGNFFNPAATSASSIAVSAAILGNANLIAAGNGSGPLSGTNAITLANLKDNTNIGPAYRQIVSDLGTSIQLAEQQSNSQQLLQEQLSNQRHSFSGVSIDEEMTNLVVSQRAYEASAQFITIIDQMLQRIISMPS
jgi:flagellar hook-associated protein 1 FlgK